MFALVVAVMATAVAGPIAVHVAAIAAAAEVTLITYRYYLLLLLVCHFTSNFLSQ